MAEIIGVVASAAGLLSLSIQIVGTTKKLKARFAAIKDLPETIDKIERNLEFLRFFLERAADATGPVIDTRYQLMLDTCWTDYNNIRDVLERLELRLENTKASSFRRRQIRSSEDVVTDIRSLDQMERRAHQHIMLAMLLVPLFRYDSASDSDPYSALLDNKITALTNQAPAIPLSTAEDTPSSDGMVTRPSLQSPKISYCGVRHCHCSCHATKTFWAFRYTPLGVILRACDRESCNARRYQFSIQMQLSRLGIPLSMLVGGEFVTGLAGMSIKPTFGCLQRVVKATSLGFRTLVRLENDDVTIQEATDILRHLSRSDPTFKTHVNPQGRTYLQELVKGGPWGQHGHQLGLQFELLALFVGEFEITSGIDTPEFILEVAGWALQSAHWAIADTLVRLGQSFEDADDPLFIAWPRPCLPRYALNEMYREPDLEAQDPFYLDFIARIMDLNEYFGGTHPLHHAVYRRNEMLVRGWIIRLGQKILVVGNFLGQTPMHWALAPESSDILSLLLGQAPALINIADKWGFTPLMYAVALGYDTAASLLIKNGANLTLRNTWNQLDFIGCAFQWNREDLIWGLLPHIKRPNSNVWAALVDLARFMVNLPSNPRTKKWMAQFWATVFAKPRVNMLLGENGSTLGHLVRTTETAQQLADAGFTRYNHQDDSGKHCLFPAVKSLNKALVRMLLDAGTLTDVQDAKGKTCLHRVVEKISSGIDPKLPKALAVFGIVHLLLTHAGAQRLVGITDNCDCPCSENGHLATDQLSAQFQDYVAVDATSPLWLVEYLSTLEDFGLEEDVRQGILAQLRLRSFSKLGIPHRCRCFGGGEEKEEGWDLKWVKEEKNIEELEAEMAELQHLPLDSLKKCLVLRMRESYDNLVEERAREAGEKERRGGARQANQTPIETPIPRITIDEYNDEIYTSVDLLLRDVGLLEDLYDEMLKNQAEPVEVVYKYLDYVVVFFKGEEIPGNQYQGGASFCRRMEWLELFQQAMGLPDLSEVCEGWRVGLNERLAVASQVVR